MSISTSITDLIQQTLPSTDEHQLGAIMAPVDTHVLVTAPPGSGKTRVLVGRYLYLLTQGFAPDQVAAVTFTNKAANEMKTRIGYAMGWDERRIKTLPIATFHSLSARWLRRHAARAGVRANYTIYDENQAHFLMRRVVKEHGLPVDPDYAMEFVSLLKSYNVSPEDLYLAAWSGKSYLTRNLLSIEQKAKAMRSDLQEAYRLYEKALEDSNAIDFDGLLLYVIRFIEEKGGIKHLGLRYLLVDECQDINTAQYDLIAAMASRDVYTYLVGDVDQSIYMFRGARPDLIEDYVAQFAPVQRRLIYNYRSREAIVDLSSDVIKPNYDSSGIVFEPVRTDRPGGVVEWVNIHPSLAAEAQDRVDELPFEARLVQALVETGCQPGEIAVLSRYNIPLVHIWQALLRLGVPAYLPPSKGGASMKNPLRWMLSLLSNSQDTVALSNLLLSIKGIGKSTANKIFASVAGKAAAVELAEALRQAADKAGGKVKPRLEKLADAMSDATAMLDEALGNRPLTAVIDAVAPAVYEVIKKPEQLYREHEAMLMTAEELPATPESLAEYLSFLSLVTSEPPAEDGNVVRLSTVHSAKGLEYRVVIIPDHEPRFQMRDFSSAEERRVFYVALTRAKDAAFIVTYYDSGMYSSQVRTAFVINALSGLSLTPFEVDQPFLADLFLARATSALIQDSE